jgi:hypothetical protein
MNGAQGELGGEFLNQRHRDQRFEFAFDSRRAPDFSPNLRLGGGFSGIDESEFKFGSSLSAICGLSRDQSRALWHLSYIFAGFPGCSVVAKSILNCVDAESGEVR